VKPARRKRIPTALRSTRQEYHQRIAQVLAERFPETVEAEPELLAHHLTEADLHAPAVDAWRQAGQHSMARSAYAEAIVLTKRSCTASKVPCC
jgi:predicted ATPase